MQLCVFVFACAECLFSGAMAQMCLSVDESSDIFDWFSKVRVTEHAKCLMENNEDVYLQILL